MNNAIENQAVRVIGLVAFFISCLASLLLVRLILENAMVFFRIAEDLADVKEAATKLGEAIEANAK